MRPLDDDTLWQRPGSRPLVLGHRGARHAAPENTFSAFDLALEEGADGVELDVRLNADGEVVVCHDADLTRVTRGRDTRRVDQLSGSQCDGVRLEGNERLPRLSEVFAWAERRGALVNVELKSDPSLALSPLRRLALPRAVAREIRAREEVAPQLWLSSFDASLLWALGLLLPRSRRGFLTANPYSTLGWLPWVLSAGPLGQAPGIAIHPEQGIVSPERLAGWHARGLRVHTWTVNQPERAVRLGALGLNAVISDCPGAVLASYSQPTSSEPPQGTAH